MGVSSCLTYEAQTWTLSEKQNIRFPTCHIKWKDKIPMSKNKRKNKMRSQQ